MQMVNNFEAQNTNIPQVIYVALNKNQGRGCEIMDITNHSYSIQEQHNSGNQDNSRFSLNHESGAFSLCSKLEAIAMFKNGSSLTEIASSYQTTVSLVMHWVNNEICIHGQYQNELQKQLTDTESSNKSNEHLSPQNESMDIDLFSNRLKSSIEFSVQDKFLAIEMYKNGAPLTQIAAKYQTTVSLVNHWINKEASIQVQYDNWFKEEVAKVNNQGNEYEVMDVTNHSDDIQEHISNNQNNSQFSLNPELQREDVYKNEVKSSIDFSLCSKLEAIAMYKNGSPLTEVASKYQTTASLVMHWVNKEGFIRTQYQNELEKQITNAESSNKSNEPSSSQNKSKEMDSFSNRLKSSIRFSLRDKILAIKMYKKGTPLMTIAAKYRTTVSLVNHWINKESSIQVQYDKWFEEEVANIESSIKSNESFTLRHQLIAIEMYKNGIPVTAIASKFETMVSFVMHWINNENFIQSQYNYWFQKDVDNIKYYVKSNNQFSPKDKLTAIELYKSGLNFVTDKFTLKDQ